MSEDKTDPPKGLTLADLKKFVDDRVSEIVKTGQQPKTDDKTSDDSKSTRTIAEQVNDALTRIRSKEERDKRDATLDQQIKDLQDKTAEKPPVERRRVHKFMGWGE